MFIIRYSIFSFSEFLFRSDWTLAASGVARVKLRQNGTVSFLIRLADFQARGGARVKLHHLLQKCSFFLIKLAVFWPEAPLI
jgi:hypothetical protein